MPYRLRLWVRNPGSQPEEATVYAGTVFEVEDPFSGIQSLATSRDVSITVPGGQTQVVDLIARCLNPRLAAPRDTLMRITSLIATGLEPDPAAGRVPAAD
jgi:hypothetical protein